MARKKQESTLPHPLVAIDLGSHSVRAMAAERTEEGLLRLLGAESSNRSLCAERGVVTNTSSASYSINESMKLLANRIQHPLLTKTFVSVGGRSMKIVEVTSHRDQVRKREIPQQLLDGMEAECKQKIESHNPQVAVLALIPYCYVLDGIPQLDAPKSHQQASNIHVKYVAFVGCKELEQKVLDSFVRTPKHVEQIYARPDALLCALASDEDLQVGCGILDLGAQTTTLTVFKGDKYVYNKVVSQGGYDITRDIQQLGMSFAYAERLKCSYGSTYLEEGQANRCFRIPEPSAPDGMLLVSWGNLVNTIVARLNQIFAPLLEDLKSLESTMGVLYITGGASMLNGMEEYVQGQTSVPVMYGSHAPWLTEDTPDELCAPNYSALVGTLILGALHRDLHPQAKPSNYLFNQLEKITQSAQTSILDMFTEQDKETTINQ